MLCVSPCNTRGFSVLFPGDVGREWQRHHLFPNPNFQTCLCTLDAQPSCCPQDRPSPAPLISVGRAAQAARIPADQQGTAPRTGFGATNPTSKPQQEDGQKRQPSHHEERDRAEGATEQKQERVRGRASHKEHRVRGVSNAGCSPGARRGCLSTTPTRVRTSRWKVPAN